MGKWLGVVASVLVCAGCCCPRYCGHSHRTRSCYGPECQQPFYSSYQTCSCDGYKPVWETAARGGRFVGEAKGEIEFRELDTRIRETISSVDSDLLLAEIKAALPSGFSVDENYDRIAQKRRVILTVRKPEGDVVFLCRVIATIHPTAKKVEFNISSGGNVDAPVERLDQVANELKTGLLKRLGKAQG